MKVEDKKEVEKQSSNSDVKAGGRMLAVVLVRGLVGIKVDARDTLFMLNLKRKHNCTIVPDTPSYRGMLNKVRNYVAYGVIDAETYDLLKSKRGKTPVVAPVVNQASTRTSYKTSGKAGKLAGEQKTFALHPPIGGFERGGIKKSFVKGGVLGDRKYKINELIKKML